MLQTFCQNCGTPNYYTTTKPKLCQECGNPFGSIPVLAKKRTNIAKTTPKPVQKPGPRRRVTPVKTEPEPPRFSIQDEDDQFFDIGGEESVPDLTENPFKVQNLGPSSKTQKLEIVQNDGKSAAMMPFGQADGLDHVGGLAPKPKKRGRKPTKRRKPKAKAIANKGIYDALKMKKGSAKENSIQVGASK